MTSTPSPAPISASQASAANGEALPAFPSRAPFPSLDETEEMSSWISYQRAIAAAWEARARLAVAALRNATNGFYYNRDGMAAEVLLERIRRGSDSALAAIGDLPSPKEQRT